MFFSIPIFKIPNIRAEPKRFVSHPIIPRRVLGRLSLSAMILGLDDLIAVLSIPAKRNGPLFFRVDASAPQTFARSVP